MKRSMRFISFFAVVAIALSLIVPSTMAAAPAKVGTYLGRLHAGEGGVALDAFFDNPDGFVADSDCNFYLADTRNNIIRRIEGSTKILSKLAGTGHYGFRDGVAGKAQFRGPEDLARGPDGEIYILDTESGRVRLLRNGVVRTWLKNLKAPSGLLLDGTTLYIADTRNNRIMKATIPNGAMTVLTTITSPNKMTIHGGFLYVSHDNKTAVSKINTSTGDGEVIKSGLEDAEGLSAYQSNVYFVAGARGIYNELWRYDPATGTLTRLLNQLETEWYNHASDILFCNDKLYMLFSAGSSIYQMSPDGTNQERIAGKNRYSDLDGPRTVAMLGRPKSIAITSNKKKLYILVNHRIKEYDFATKQLKFLAGHSNDNWRDGPGEFSRMSGATQIVLSPDGSRVYFADRNNNRIRYLRVADNTLVTLTGAGETNQFGGDDNGYAEGSACPTELSRGVAGCAYFDRPQGIAVTSNGGKLYIADTENHRIRAVDVATGVTELVAGSGTPGLINGIGANARFKTPVSLVLSKDGKKLWVVELGNHAVRQVDLTNNRVTTVVGSGRPGYREGLFRNARLSYPDSIAQGPGNTLFLSEVGDQRIRRINLNTRTIELVAGNGARGTSNANNGKKATFFSPRGMVMISSKRLLVADQLNDLLRAIDLR